jgi:hypothetical protein
MREITAHKVEGLNESIKIEVLDDPGPGGANHRYRLTFGASGDEYFSGEEFVEFQKGPLAETGPNGISNEALLAIVIDRLQCFQAGEFRCRENAIAITKLEEAMHWLHQRTRERVARGVEGTMAK